MAYETRPETGSLFKNDKKETDSHPDYKGSALLGGVDHWVDAWINTSNSGVKYMSLKFKPKEARSGNGSQGAPMQRAEPADLDDDVPFISSDPSLEWRVG